METLVSLMMTLTGNGATSSVLLKQCLSCPWRPGQHVWDLGSAVVVNLQYIYIRHLMNPSTTCLHPKQALLLLLLQSSLGEQGIYYPLKSTGDSVFMYSSL